MSILLYEQGQGHEAQGLGAPDFTINCKVIVGTVGESRAKENNFCLRCHSNESIMLASTVLCQTCKYDLKLSMNNENTPFHTHIILLYRKQNQSFTLPYCH